MDTEHRERERERGNAWDEKFITADSNITTAVIMTMSTSSWKTLECRVIVVAVGRC